MNEGLVPTVIVTEVGIKHAIQNAQYAFKSCMGKRAIQRALYLKHPEQDDCSTF